MVLLWFLLLAAILRIEELLFKSQGIPVSFLSSTTATCMLSQYWVSPDDVRYEELRKANLRNGRLA